MSAATAPAAAAAAATDVPTVAVVMPAHRGGPDLAASVGSVLALHPPPDDFIVVIDGGDPAVACQLHPTIRTVDIPASGPAAARNAGVRQTATDLVVFVDSDVVVGPTLVADVRRVLGGSASDEPAVAPPDALIGSYDDRPAATTLVSQFRNLLHHWTHQRAAGRGHTFWGACGAIRRSAFDAVGGFDERYRDATIEDIELGERLTAAGFDIVVVPDIQVTHLKRWTLANMVHTDIVKRGVPWSRLMIADGSMADDLNTTRRARVTVALAGLLVAVSVIAVLPLPRGRRRARVLAVVSAAALTWRDRAFLGFLRRRRSAWFAARAAPLMWIHHICAGTAFAWALVTWPVVRRRTGTSVTP